MKGNIIAGVVALLLVSLLPLQSFARVAIYDSTYIRTNSIAGKNIARDAVDSTRVRSGSIATSDIGGIFFAVYSGNPGADSVDVAVSGVLSTSRVIGQLNTDRADSSIYIQAVVPRADTVRVYLNMKPARTVKASLFGFK